MQNSSTDPHITKSCSKSIMYSTLQLKYHMLTSKNVKKKIKDNKWDNK